MRKSTQKIVMSALFAALIALMTAYIGHIPMGAHGGYIHLGDTWIYLAAGLLPTAYAAAAAVIGAGLADLLTAPVWVVATVMIKMLMTLCFTSKKGRIVCLRNVIATFISGVICVGGYALAEEIMFGTWVASVAGNIVQATASAVLFVIIGLVLDRCSIKVSA